MANEVKGVIAGAKGEPVRVETILVPEPGPGEALVRVKACGVCHTDLHYREGAITDDFPFLLGHEAAGFIEKIGHPYPRPYPRRHVGTEQGIPHDKPRQKRDCSPH